MMTRYGGHVCSGDQRIAAAGGDDRGENKQSGTRQRTMPPDKDGRAVLQRSRRQSVVDHRAAMDQVKLETKWPPDRKSTIVDASEFGIYKEPADGRLLRHTDRATGCLLVLSLMAAAAVVLYFTLFDYSAQTAQVPFVGPVVSYAKYVKDKQVAVGPGNRSADGLLAAVLGVKNAADNHTSAVRARAAHEDAVAAHEDAVAAETVDAVAAHEDAVAAETVDAGGGGRRMRLYPTPRGPTPVRPAASAGTSGRRDEHYYRGAPGSPADGLYGFGRRSDFPQLSAYRAPFPPKSVLAVMEYVTGPSPPPVHRTADVADHMVAQESRTRHAPAVRLAEEVNGFLPDANAPPASAGGAKRFRNQFGPAARLRPPAAAFPDDFMKPPDPGARFSTDFATDALHAGTSGVPPSHTDAVFRSPSERGHPVPDAPSPNRAKAKRTKNRKPISVMLDIYPISDRERENERPDLVDDEEEDHSEMFTSLKNNLQQSDSDNLLFRLNLFPKYNDGGRRMSKNVKYEDENNQKPTIHLTTQTPLRVEEDDGRREDEESFGPEYTLESKNMADVSKIQLA